MYFLLLLFGDFFLIHDEQPSWYYVGIIYLVVQ